MFGFGKCPDLYDFAWKLPIHRTAAASIIYKDIGSSEEGTVEIFYWGHGTRDMGHGTQDTGTLGCPWDPLVALGEIAPNWAMFVEVTLVSSGQEPQISSNPRETSLLHMRNESKGGTNTTRSHR